MLVWLGISTILAFIAALAAVLSAAPPAPSFHLAFSAGALPLICGAIIHFVPVLTRSAAPSVLIRLLPLAVQAAGVATPLALGGVLPYWLLHPAATVTALAAVLLAFWIARRLRATLGAPHPGARWYGAALLCLFLAVSLVPLWLALPELRPALRLFHLHLNTLGLIGLAALGTLPVLLPTALGRPESTAALRLRRDLLPAVVGALLVAAGAAGAIWLALPGALLLGWVVVGDLIAWRRAYGAKLGAGEAAPLVAAACGFLVLLLAGMAHGIGWLAARPALAAYVVLFLLPLVTGALAQLLPVWRHPGPVTPRRRRLGARLLVGSCWRALLFLAGGVLLLFDLAAGWLLGAAGLLLFAVVLLRAFRLDSPEPSDDNSRPNRPPSSPASP